MAYGGPSRLEDVEPFLLDVRGGRATPPELVEEVRERYRAIGGGSPLLERTREQAAALEARLNRPGEAGPWRVFVGMRHWHPYIRRAVGEIAAGGFERPVALCLAPQYSGISVGAYFRALDEALAELPEGVLRPEVARVPSWHDHPGFVTALAHQVERAVRRFPAGERRDLQVIFTAHSLPEAALEEGDPYDRQVRETARAVAERAGVPAWRVAFQSAGARPGAWLGPSLDQVLQELADGDRPPVLVAPVGFVSDHVEVLYDLDVEARARARELGLHLERTASLNTSPALIDALADLVGQAEGGEG